MTRVTHREAAFVLSKVMTSSSYPREGRRRELARGCREMQQTKEPAVGLERERHLLAGGGGGSRLHMNLTCFGRRIRPNYNCDAGRADWLDQVDGHMVSCRSPPKFAQSSPCLLPYSPARTFFWGQVSPPTCNIPAPFFCSAHFELFIPCPYYQTPLSRQFALAI